MFSIIFGILALVALCVGWFSTILGSSSPADYLVYLGGILTLLAVVLAFLAGYNV